MSEHAPCPPSSAHIWVHCPMWVTMNRLYPEKEQGEPAREGEAAHWVVAEALGNRVTAEGQYAPNGWVIDEDMIDGADLVLSAIEMHFRSLVQSEQRLTMAQRIHPMNWGTPDIWWVDFPNRIIYLLDYKYGHGYVEVFENWQLADYLAGIADRLQLNGLQEQEWTVHAGIVQPRVFHREGHVRWHRSPLTDYRAMWNRLRYAAELAMGDEPPAQPGEHCEHCPGRHSCQALHRRVANMSVHFDYAAPLELDDNAVGYELRWLRQLSEMVQARITGLEADVEARLRAQHAIPFFRLDKKPGREVWTISSEAAIALASLFGADIAKPPECLTPNQTRKLGVPDEMVSANAKRQTTTLKLTEVSEKEVRRIFRK